MTPGYCKICGCWRESLDRDHIIPKCFGGTNIVENIQLICQNCHHDKTNNEFREYRSKKISALNKARVGRSLSEEHRKRISLGTKGNPKLLAANRGRFGSQSPMFGKHHSEETKQKIRERLKGNQHTIGRRLSKEHAERLLEVNTGRKNTKEAKIKMSDSRKKYNALTPREKFEIAQKRAIQLLAKANQLTTEILNG